MKCPCCKAESEFEDTLGAICGVCYWERDEWEESDEKDSLGPNGLPISEYRKRWKEAGKPVGLPPYAWPLAL